MLQSNLEKGIIGDDSDLLKRRNTYGSNTYPQKPGRSFWVILRLIVILTCTTKARFNNDFIFSYVSEIYACFLPIFLL